MNAAPHRHMIPRRPLLWLTAALLFLVPTMLGNLASWVPLLFLISLLAKFWLEKKDRRLRSVAWKIVLAIIGFGAVFATYGTVLGLEPGVSLLVVLVSLKILESHTANDFHVLIMVGWVLCLCAFLVAQDFQIALCVLGAFVLLIAALVQFHRRRAPGGALGPPLGTSLKLLAQALPLVLLLFFLFPRGTGGMRLRIVGATRDSTGFSGELSPGSIASIANSDDLAFRVEFPDGNMPPHSSLYWRGAVLWDGDGLNWNAGEGLGQARPSQQRTGAPIRQRITLEPHAGRWLFALDRPLAAPPGVILAPGRYLRSVRPISTIRRYEIASVPDAGEDDLQERSRTLQLPSTVSAEMRQLVGTWTAQTGDSLAIVKAALLFFRTQGFVYSISPGQYLGPDALSDLLFRRKSGFCEHYAAAFATLMRMAGIPSRVVVGYLGGQFNQYGNYLLVRQSDAHAWCEVWLPASGWTRVDPTSVIAPARLSLGSLREMRTTFVRGQPTAGRAAPSYTFTSSGILDEARLAWDTVSYAWDSGVLSFDIDGQREFLTQFGFNGAPGLPQLLWITLAVAVLLAAYAALIAWRARTRTDVIKKLYENFCRKTARIGTKRLASEGPSDFAARAARQLPQHATRIQRIASLYIALRYSPNASPPLLKTFAADVRAFTNRVARG